MPAAAAGGRTSRLGIRDGRRLRVLVVDDHEVVQWGLRLMLGRQPWVERCVVAGDGSQAESLSRRYDPHLAVIDLFVGEESGMDLCERLRAVVPWLRVLLISGAGTISPTAARAVGASGFLAKDTSADRIVDAVGRIGVGETVFERGDAPPTWLSERERQVLELMAAGATNPEIAAALNLSRHTIKEYTSSLYRRLGARNRMEAVRQGRRLGLVS